MRRFTVVCPGEGPIEILTPMEMDKLIWSYFRDYKLLHIIDPPPIRKRRRTK